MKRFIAVILSLLLVGLFVGGAVGESKIVLKGVTYAPMTRKDAMMELTRKLIAKVEEISGGKVVINVLGGPEVTAAKEQMGALRRGIFDVVFTAAYHMSAVPEIRTLTITTIEPWEARETGQWNALNEAHKKRMGCVYMGRISTHAKYFLYSNKEIKSMADLKGMKMRSIAMYQPFLKALGCTTVSMPMTEIYTALERGLVQGYAFPIWIHRLSLEEVTKYRINHPFYPGSSTAWYMNQKKYESLPAHAKKALTDAAKWIERYSPTVTEGYQDKENKYQLAGGVKFVEISDGKEMVDLIHRKAWEKVYKVLPETAAELEKMATDPNYRPK